MPRLDAGELSKWSGGRWVGFPPSDIGGVCHDTRRLKPGQLYLALRGQHFDGHDFVSEAARCGACGAVVEESWPGLAVPEGFPLLRVQDSGAALSAMASGWLRKQSPKVIGVTGSVGKSTVKDLIYTLLKDHCRAAASRGNWNNEIGLPLSILEMEPGTETLVIELGTNHPGELAELCKLASPHWGVVTHVGPSHLEFFRSVEGVAAEKAVLLESLPLNGLAFIRADVAHADRLAKNVKCPVVRVAMAGAADYVCLSRDKSVMEVEERCSRARELIPLPVPGEHQAANLLLALAVVRRAGVGWDGIRRAIGDYSPAEMRWQKESIGAVTIVNDAYNANPLSMAAAIRTFWEMDGVSGGKWLALGDMRELGAYAKAEHEAVGKLVASLSGWSGLVAVGELAAFVAEGAVSAPGGPGCGIVIKTQDADEAADRLARLLRAGDALLIKGSRAMRMERIAAILKDKICGKAASEAN